MIHKVMGYKTIADDRVMLSYSEKLDSNIIKEHELDFVKVLDKYKDKETQSLNITSVAISAAITSYARIHITRIKLYILNNLGGKIYYSDTDSIVTNVKLPDSMVDLNELGKLKLEHTVNTGIFISGKLYALRAVKDNHEYDIITAKGVNSSSIEFKDFIMMLEKKDIENVTKVQSKKDWEIGHVVISEEKVKIFYNSYNKREKLYDLKGYWINTKPKLINSIDKQLVLYKPINQLIVYKDIYNQNTTILSKLTLNTLYPYLVTSILLPISIIAYILLNNIEDEDNTSTYLEAESEYLDISSNHNINNNIITNVEQNIHKEPIDKESMDKEFINEESVDKEFIGEESLDSNTLLEEKKVTLDGKEFTKDDFPPSDKNGTLFENFESYIDIYQKYRW